MSLVQAGAYALIMWSGRVRMALQDQSLHYHLPRLQAAPRAAFCYARAVPTHLLYGSTAKGSLSQRQWQCKALYNSASDGDDSPASGSIHLIVGPMFAGKTTALLKRVQAEALAGRNITVVKSDKDTRYGLDNIICHDGMKMPCWAVPSLSSFRTKLGEKAYAKLDVIGIDEAQFLKDLYSFCRVAADTDGKRLIVAGLDGDFLRNRFGTILDLVPLADTVVKLSSRCEVCGKPAFFTFRKTDNESKEVIGGAEVYMPVCRQHYLAGRCTREAARMIINAQEVILQKQDAMANSP